MVLYASITFSGTNWLWPAAIFLIAAMILVGWSYRTAPPGIAKWLCPLLKLMGVAALAFCLLEPLWSGQRVQPGANLFAILADNSQSLKITDQGESQPRSQKLQELLDPAKAGWPASLAEDFEVRRYQFDSQLQAAMDFSNLKFDGRSSALINSLKTLATRFQDRRLAGVLVFTDGIATDVMTELPNLRGLPPIYPVVIGSREPVRDVAVAQVHVSQTPFEDAPVTIQADITASGLRNENIVARLLDRTGKIVQEQTQRATRDNSPLAFRFQLRPDKPGVSFYELRTAVRSDLEQPGHDAKTREATLANNSRVLAVDRGSGPYRVLYVAGRPNWEFKFLNRAIQEDEQVQLVGLIRVAKREPKFDFRGRAGETSNPLYRGFGNQSREETERYDQPVLSRLNTRDELELRSGFPRTPEDLYGYHAIILDDMEAEFFGPDQALLLQKFVSERGGGFLMLGGAESFQQGQYDRTPIGAMLPVYLDRTESFKNPPHARLNLAREGWLQAWARLRDNETDEKTRILEMPSFEVMNPLREIKPGASVIATATDESGKDFPALVVQRFGAGRSAALTIGDLWRWGMRDPQARHDLEKSWRQLIRWLVTDVPQRVELTAQKSPGDIADMVVLQTKVRDQKFQPLDNATVTIEIQAAQMTNATGPVTNLIRLTAEASATVPGLYTASFVARSSGGYRALAVVTNDVGAEAGRSETGWSTDLEAEEFHTTTPNLALLEHIARQTGGEVVSPDRLSALVKSLPTRKAPVMEPWTTPLWHTPVMFGLALLCLLAEWGVRRWKGLP
jgi:uncharacterized membrane protein